MKMCRIVLLVMLPVWGCAQTEPPHVEKVIDLLQRVQMVVNLGDASLNAAVASIECQANTNQSPSSMIKIKIEGVPEAVACGHTHDYLVRDS